MAGTNIDNCVAIAFQNQNKIHKILQKAHLDCLALRKDKKKDRDKSRSFLSHPFFERGLFFSYQFHCQFEVIINCFVANAIEERFRTITNIVFSSVDSNFTC